MLSENFFSEDKSFELKGAFLVYGRGQQALATFHSVQESQNTGRRFIAPGQPASRADFLEVAKQVANVKEPEAKETISLFPSNLLYLSERRMVWHTPAQKRPLFVSTSDKTFNADVNGKMVPHPALLFVARCDDMHRGDMYVFALESDERPTMETPLYRAPYMNVYAAGHLCEGSYRLPETTNPQEISNWESAFFETHFSHTNVDGRTLCAHPHGHNAMWRELARLELIRQNARSMRSTGFPTRYLNLLQKPATVGEALGI